MVGLLYWKWWYSDMVIEGLVKSRWAVEFVIVSAWVLNLNSNVEDSSVLQYMLNLFEDLEWVLSSNMGAKSILSIGKSPDVEVMDTMDTFNILNQLLSLLEVNASRCSLHKSQDALLDGRVWGGNNDQSENKGDKGVGNLSLRPEPDDNCSNDNSNWVQEISENVESSTGHVDVFCFLLSLEKGLFVAVAVAMGVSMVVTTWTVIVTGVSNFVATKNGHLNNIEDEAGNSCHKHNVFLDFRGSQESVISSK